MFFERRRYKIEERTDIDVLARELTEMTWCLCNGFKFKGVWFLNDAGSEDGAQEYAAIIKGPDGFYYQVESITFSWVDATKAKEILSECAAYALGIDKKPPIRKQVYPNFNHVGGPCRHCA